jgi:dTDP-4-amino-4,6-dideoxygalactose transaminase
MYKEKLIKLFKNKTAFNNVIFSGRANTIIWNIGLFLKKNYEEPRVLMPSTLCVSPLIIFLNLNIKVDFVDIDPNNGLMNIKILKKKLKKKKYNLIFYVNLFGNIDDQANIKKIKRNNSDLIIVQDLAQTFISNNKNKNLKELFGDIIILSFGYSKIFDLSHGSIMLSKNKDIYNFIKKKKVFPNADINKYKEKYLIWYKNKFLKNFPIKKKETQLFAKRLYLINFNKQFYKKIYYKVTNLKKEEIRMNKLFKIYKNIFVSKKIRIIDTKKKFIPWRFSFLVKRNRNKILYELRDNGFDASSYYKSLNVKSKKTRYFDKKVINLWLDNQVSEEKILLQYKIIKNLL